MSASLLLSDIPLADMMLACSAYALGVASPGPSNLAVMATAMKRGRRAGIVFALGVVAGSATWGACAALGLSSILLRYEPVAAAIRVFGGLYLLWLAAKSARSTMTSNAPVAESCSDAGTSAASLFVRGAALHLTNPKAILVWLCVVALALPAGAPGIVAWMVVLGCVAIGVATFCGYALVFSTARAQRLHRRMQRPFAGVLAIAFGYAGVRMLAAR